jgi:cell division protein ZapE
MRLLDDYQHRIDAGMISDDPAQRAAIAPLDDLLHHLKAPRSFFGFRKAAPPQGVYLYGGVGRGKSMLMDRFAEVARQGGMALARFHFHDFMTAVHDHIHHPDLAKKADPARHVAAAISKGARVICFDEMEVRDIADAMILARVMGGFFDDGGVLVATSNRHPDDLYEGGLHRDRFLPFIALLKEKAILHELLSPTDYRQQLLASLPAWYCPDDAEAEASMAKIFGMLTEGHEIEPVSVTVAGRHIRFDHAANNIARVHFDEVCKTALAARDYLALADRYTGLLISHIPRLDDTLRNETRRLMWLVDAFYDRGRFLVCSAAADIPKIYQGRDWEKEFPRTASRLTQMTKI